MSGQDTPATAPRFTWDAHTAAAVWVLGALLFLVLVRAGFRPALGRL